MKVTVVDLGGPFGPLRSYLELVPEMEALGCEFSFVAPETSTEILGQLATEGRYQSVSPRHTLSRDIAVGRAVRRSVRLGAVLIHANTTSAMRGAFLGTVVAGTPLVVHLRNSQLSSRERLMIKMLSRVHRRTSFLAVSEAAVAAAGSSLPESPTVVADPVSPGDRRSRLMSEGSFRIGVVANQQPTKGLDILVEIIAKLNGDAIMFNVYGSAGIQPPGNDYVSRAILRLRESSLEEMVTFHGVVPDFRLRLTDLDAVLITSRRESFSRVSAEAMLAGVPVIAPAIPGLLDTVDGGRLAEMYVPENSSSASEAIRKVMSDYPSALERAKDAREWAMDRFQPASIAANIMRLYQQHS